MSENISKSILEKLEKIAEEAEEDLEDVLMFFSLLKTALKKHPQNIGISDVKLEKRTYNALAENYNAEKFKKAKEFIFIPFGISSESKDQNKALREEILKDFANLEKRDIMISGLTGDGSDSKIMILKVSDKEIDNKDVLFRDVYKPVKNKSSIKTTVINKQTVVIAGDLWSPGDTPIPRDYRKEITKEGYEPYENKQYSRPLDPKYSMSLFGIGMFPGSKDVKVKDPETGEVVTIQQPKKLHIDGRFAKVKFNGDFADPNTPNYICKKPISFVECKVKAFESRFTNELFLGTVAKDGIEITPPKTGLSIIKTVRNINKVVHKKAVQIEALAATLADREIPKQQLKKVNDLNDLYNKFIVVDYIPVIDLAEIDDYHLGHRAIRDKDNNIVKSEKGWDNTDFNSIALSECSLSGVYEKEGKPPKMIITDSSLPERESLFLKFANGIDSNLPASTVLVCLTTSRGNQVYDTDTKKWVVDAENARAIAKIKGIKVLISFGELKDTIASIKKKIGEKKLKSDL